MATTDTTERVAKPKQTLRNQPTRAAQSRRTVQHIRWQLADMREEHANLTSDFVRIGLASDWGDPSLPEREEHIDLLAELIKNQERELVKARALHALDVLAEQEAQEAAESTATTAAIRAAS